MHLSALPQDQVQGVANKPPSPVGDDRSHLRCKAPQLSYRSGQKLWAAAEAEGMRAGLPWQRDDIGESGKGIFFKNGHKHT